MRGSIVPMPGTATDACYESGFQRLARNNTRSHCI
jgi:hypothetical protein